jgi:N-methylhydantoinase A
VTDSDLVLGYLYAENFLGGRMRLDMALAERALQAVGQKIGLTAREAAWGIHDIVNENMAAAARTHIAEQGLDARHFTMVATGGAGPVHAVDVARRLRIPRVLCPIASGVGSCLGFLAAPARADQSWSKLELVQEIDRADLARRMDRARMRIADDLAQAGTGVREIVWQASAEMRYLGQGAQVEIGFGQANVADISLQALQSAFEAEYVRLYGRLVPGGVPEVVTWRLVGESPRGLRKYRFADNAGRTSTRPERERSIYLPHEKRYGTVPVYDRYALEPGTSLAAPLVMVEPESTLVVACPATATILPSGTVEVLVKELA